MPKSRHSLNWLARVQSIIKNTINTYQNKANYYKESKQALKRIVQMNFSPHICSKQVSNSLRNLQPTFSWTMFFGLSGRKIYLSAKKCVMKRTLDWDCFMSKKCGRLRSRGVRSKSGTLQSTKCFETFNFKKMNEIKIFWSDARLCLLLTE